MKTADGENLDFFIAVFISDQALEFNAFPNDENDFKCCRFPSQFAHCPDKTYLFESNFYLQL